MLSRISIEGFKCFDKTELALGKMNLLTGTNSSGKSSFIQSLLLLMQQTEQGKNPLNGKYTHLGLWQDVKNSITNPRRIKISAVEQGDIQEHCTFEFDMDSFRVFSGKKFLAKKDFVYLSAERVGAEDVYQQNLTDEYRIGIHGEYAFDYLSLERMNGLREPYFLYPDVGVNLGNQVDYWLDYITGYVITSERIPGTEIVKVSYRQSRGGNREIKPNHVGTGISYVANVIISALSCRKDSLFVIENPEIHLHPKAQSKMLDFFCFLAARGLQIIVETHSDHIFNGLRKNIKMNRISDSDSKIYFFRQDDNLISTPVKILINKDGVIRNHEKGLFDQFDEDLDELLGL